MNPPPTGRGRFGNARILRNWKDCFATPFSKGAIGLFCHLIQETFNLLFFTLESFEVPLSSSRSVRCVSHWNPSWRLPCLRGGACREKGWCVLQKPNTKKKHCGRMLREEQLHHSFFLRSHSSSLSFFFGLHKNKTASWRFQSHINKIPFARLPNNFWLA